jgi:hypothetical protein
MDILAHGLWAGIGTAALARHRPVTARTAAATVALAMAPDLAQLLPLVGAALVEPGGWSALEAYAVATPGLEPSMAPAVSLWAHHLHCVMHSAVIAGAASLALGFALGRLWLPLLGWWSHIVIDVLTHSAEFYPAPVLYPFTQRGFDGWAWNTPSALVLNYVAITAAVAWLLATRRQGAR